MLTVVSWFPRRRERKSPTQPGDSCRDKGRARAQLCPKEQPMIRFRYDQTMLILAGPHGLSFFLSFFHSFSITQFESTRGCPHVVPTRVGPAVSTPPRNWVTIFSRVLLVNEAGGGRQAATSGANNDGPTGFCAKVLPGGKSLTLIFLFFC